MTSRRLIAGSVLALCAGALPPAPPIRDVRGYVPDEEKVADVKIGVDTTDTRAGQARHAVEHRDLRRSDLVLHFDRAGALCVLQAGRNEARDPGRAIQRRRQGRRRPQLRHRRWPGHRPRRSRDAEPRQGDDASCSRCSATWAPCRPSAPGSEQRPDARRAATAQARRIRINEKAPEISRGLFSCAALPRLQMRERGEQQQRHDVRDLDHRVDRRDRRCPCTDRRRCRR